MPSNDLTPGARRRLRKLLLDAFDLEQLRLLSADMGFDYDGELAGNTAAGKVHDLIQQMKRRGRLQELLDAAAEERPSVDWLKLDLVQGESAAEPARGAGEAWTDGPEGYTDQKTGLLMLPVPAGEFLFGEDKRVQYLPAYWIAKTPVTNALYVRFIAASGHEPPEHWEGSGPPVAIADHPVTFVSWHDAFEYANWAGMRLPTEQEWEKAARGTDGRIYPWGNTWRDGVCNTNDDGIWGPTPVGKYSPVGDSPTGCVDMAGNVWEWTSSWHGKRREYRVSRGGSWSKGPEGYRVAYREFKDRSDMVDDDIGFRPVSDSGPRS